MLNVRLAGGHLYGKQLFTWLSLVVSLMASLFVLCLFPLDVLDEIWDVIESVYEGFLTYSSKASDITPFEKNVEESEWQKTSLLTPTVVLNHSPMLPFNCTALVALS